MDTELSFVVAHTHALALMRPSTLHVVLVEMPAPYWTIAQQLCITKKDDSPRERLFTGRGLWMVTFEKLLRGAYHDSAHGLLRYAFRRFSCSR